MKRAEPVGRQAPTPAVGRANGRARGRRIQVRRSGVHGKGVFAVAPIAAGERVIEYVGEVITWKEALRRHPHDPAQPNHTFYFHIDDEHVIDAGVGGNAARWINHACDPNAMRSGVKVFAWRDIAAGEEITIDYRLNAFDGDSWPCECHSPSCTGTVFGSFFALREERQRLYLPYAPTFIRQEYRRRQPGR